MLIDLSQALGVKGWHEAAINAANEALQIDLGRSGADHRENETDLEQLRDLMAHRIAPHRDAASVSAGSSPDSTHDRVRRERRRD